MTRSIRFITEPIEVSYTIPPRFRLKPSVPDRFVWRKETFAIERVQQEWRQADAPRLSRRFKRVGVARIFFRVETANRRVFDIYFDPSLNKGSWILSKEILDEPN